MPWIYLIIASVFEVAWVAALKNVDSFRNYGMLSVALVLLLISVLFLSLAIRDIPVGIAYAVWTGFGIIGALAIGILFYHEPIGGIQIMCVCMIILGVVGLRLYAPQTI